jgi:aerobic-type carbon monoxide dehydrogenase small subunit (CoxS/CutS family)
MTELSVAFTLNGERRAIRVPAHRTLLSLLRDDLGVMDVKEGCGEGVCGTCTVLLDGEPVSSCLVLAGRVDGRDVVTLSGLREGDALHPLQEAFVAHGAAQCGFCTPGMILTAYAFLRDYPRSTRAEVRRAIAGNLCRCTGYTKIVDAIAAAAGEGGPQDGA